MYIGDYLKEREGEMWTSEDTAEVLRILREVDALAIAMAKMREAECAKQQAV